MKVMCSKFLQLFGFSILSASVLVSTPASADDLPCVIRAINWLNVPPGFTVNTVEFTTVALHSKGIAAFAKGTLTNLACSAAPWGIGQAQCLHSDPAAALLSDRVANIEGPDQPFDVHKPLSLQVASIPKNSLGEILMRQPNAIYHFHPACVGDLLTGNDQWGNHWTMSFQFSSRTKVN